MLSNHTTNRKQIQVLHLHTYAKDLTIFLLDKENYTTNHKQILILHFLPFWLWEHCVMESTRKNKSTLRWKLDSVSNLWMRSSTTCRSQGLRICKHTEIVSIQKLNSHTFQPSVRYLKLQSANTSRETVAKHFHRTKYIERCIAGNRNYYVSPWFTLSPKPYWTSYWKCK